MTHIDVSSIVWTLIDNGKLANQIVRSVATIVKCYLDDLFHDTDSLFT